LVNQLVINTETYMPSFINAYPSVGKGTFHPLTNNQLIANVSLPAHIRQ